MLAGTLLGIVVLCGASGNTRYWVLLWVMRSFGNTHYWVSLGLMWAAFINEL
jgi:hypothetical protein